MTEPTAGPEGPHDDGEATPDYQSTDQIPRIRTWPSKEWLRQAAEFKAFTIAAAGTTYRVSVEEVEE